MAYRIGMIGTDGHVGMVLDGIPKIEGASLCACAKGHPGDDLDRLRKHAAFTGDTTCYDRFEDMLAAERLDIVGICRPYHLNAEASIAAAQHGAAIVSEKPVATTLEDLDRLEQTLRDTGVRFTAMFGMRLQPAFQAARKAVADGLVGRPILATGQKSYKFGVRPEFYRNRQTYGGTIPWVAIHAVDYVRWAAGLDFTRVAALHGNAAHPDYPGCEDHGGILFTCQDGESALVHFDYLRPAEAPTHGDDRLRIAGDRGVVEVTECGERAQLIAPDAGLVDLPLAEERDFLVDLIEELEGGAPHVVGPDEAIAVTRICLLAREAADTGKVVEIP